MKDQVKKDIIVEEPPCVIFTLMTLTNILINLDHGILPACTNQLKERFKISEAELGVLGSIVYVGIVIMGLFAGRLYQHFNSKLLTVIALVCLEGTLLLFVLSEHKIAAYISRFFTGVFQVFLLVYYPIWIDKFGGQKKTAWLTLLQICVPVGIFMGYGITSLVISIGYTYRTSFYIQIFLVAGFIFAFIFLSKKKLDSRRHLSQDLVQSALPNQSEVSQAKQNKLKYQFWYMMRKLFRSKMYLVGTLTMSVILFLSTGIQFWLTDYYINVLHFDRGAVNIAYAVVSITGPTSGCGFGGYIVSKMGGYENPKTVYYVLTFASIGIGAALFIPFIDQFYSLGVLLWIVLFFGGAMMPGLTGIMMCSVSPYLRAFGNSNGQIIKNIFGYMPSPFVYGLFNSLYGERAGIKFLMFWGLWAPALLGYGSIHKYRQLQKLKEKAKLDNKAEAQQKDQIIYSDNEGENELEGIEALVNEQMSPQKMDKSMVQQTDTNQILQKKQSQEQFEKQND